MVVEASRVAVGTIHVTGITMISLLASFVFYVGLARLLSPDDVGIVSLMLSTIAIFNTLSLLALNSAVIKYVSEFLGRGDKALASGASRKAFKAITLISAPAFAASAIVSPLILDWMFHGQIALPILLLLLGVGLILNYTSYYGAVMTGLAMFGTVALQNIIFTVGSRMPALAFAFTGLGVNSVPLGFFVGALVCLGFSVLRVKGRMSGSNMGFPLRDLFSFSIPMYAFNIVQLVQGWMDVLILYGVTSALATTGIYYIVTASTSMLAILWSPLVFTLLPTLSSRHGAMGVDAVAYALMRALKLIVPLVIVVSAALTAVSPTALTIMYGRNYVEGALPFAILTSLSIFAAFSALFITALQAINRTTPIAIAGALSLLANLGVLLFLVGPLGAVGASLGRASMIIVSFAATYLALRRFMKIRWNAIPILKASLTALLVGVPLFLLDFWMRLTGVSPLTTAIIDLALLVSTSLACFKVLKILDTEDLELLRSVLPTKLKGLIKLIS